MVADMELLAEWILPIGLIIGALVTAGVRWGITASLLAVFIYDLDQADMLWYDTAWAGDRIVAEPTQTLVWVLLAIAIVEIVVEMVTPLATMALTVTRPAAAGALGVALIGTGWVTSIAGAALGVALGALGAWVASTLLAGAARAGGHPSILSLFMSIAGLLLALVAVFVPFGGYLVAAIFLRAAFRIRRRSDEKHAGLRILAG